MSGDGPACNAGFEPNPDVSGIGVRTSFYAQAVLLALLAARSNNQNEITDALTTLIVTNLAICVTTLYLGLKSDPDLNLYDGLVVCYLLLASWAAIFFTLPQYNRFRKFDPWIKWLAVAQSYLVFATFIAVYKTAPYFGSCPDYNHNARMVIFGDFSATRSGRIFGLVGTSLLIVGYTLMVLFDYWGNGSKEQKEKIQQLKELKPQGSDDVPNITVEKDPQTPSVNGAIDNALSQEPPSPATSRGRTSKRRRRHKHRGHDTTNFNIGVDGRVVLHVAVIVIVSTLAIVNTELLRNYNHPLPVDKDWGFGQILPMFLTILPLKRTVMAFWQYGFTKKRVAERGRRVRLRTRNNGSLSPCASSIADLPQSPLSPGSATSASGSGRPTSGGLSDHLHPAWNPLAAMVAMAQGHASTSGGAHVGGAHIEEVPSSEDEDEAGSDADDEDAPSQGSSSARRRGGHDRVATAV